MIMRVDCYNACECPISAVEYGDTCYYRGELYLKVNPCAFPVDIITSCVIVSLGDGMLQMVDSDTLVTLADTKVVANTKDVHF